MTVQILALTQRAEDLAFCKKIAENTGFDYFQITEETDLARALINRPRSLVFWDVDGPDFSVKNSPYSVHKVLPSLTKNLKPRYAFGLASQSVFELSELSRVTAIGHYIVRNYDDFGVTWVSRLCSALHSTNPFGLENYKDPDSSIQKIELKASNEKKAALEAVSRLLERRSIHPRALQMVIRILDEVLMNAIFSAPKDWSGRFYRRESHRDSEFVFTDGEKVMLSMTFNKDFVSFAVLDRFGSFSADRAWDAVRKDYQTDSYTVNEKTKSAGLGLNGIAASGVAMMISCRPGITTEVVVSFPYFSSFKETKNCFRSFSFNIRG